MTTTLVQLTEDGFDAAYTLRTNHFNPNASWTYGEGTGCLFETYGEELQFVRSQDPATIWTLIDGDDADQYIVSGYHFVNRIGYFISTTPVPDDLDIEVHIPMNDEA
jgi:hypothetical protein